VELLLGALLGLVGSLAAAIYYDRATQPCLEVIPNDEAPVGGQRPHADYRHQFLEIKIRQKKAWLLFPLRRPAWRCRVTFDVFRDDGSRAIQERIIGRWSGSLQPYRTQLVNDKLVPIPDDSLLPFGQTFDVHGSSEEKVGVALKYQGFDHCWIFSNESYPQKIPWEKPEWRLESGRYYIAVRLHYDSTLAEPKRTWWILLRNDGKQFSDWGVRIVPRPDFLAD